MENHKVQFEFKLTQAAKHWDYTRKSRKERSGHWVKGTQQSRLVSRGGDKEVMHLLIKCMSTKPDKREDAKQKRAIMTGK